MTRLHSRSALPCPDRSQTVLGGKVEVSSLTSFEFTDYSTFANPHPMLNAGNLRSTRFS